MHEASVVACPVTHQPIRVTRSQVGAVEVSSVRPGVPRAQSEPTRLAPLRASRRDLIGQTIDGKYRVRAMLGEGGMGAVLEAEHQVIGRIVAMKVLHVAQASKSVAVKRFHQEARAAGGIGHPNICEVFDFGSLGDGSPYLVMERLQGQTLASRIETEGGLPFGDVVDTVIQVLSGLGAAHERGILHRDIKPENVFLAERPGYPPIVKLLDFGVSKIVAGATQGEWDDETDLTKTGMVMGTPYYMSPEQARGDRNLDGRVDIYACGVLLYEALTGKRPFIANNYNTLLVMILKGTTAPPRAHRASIPIDLEQIIAKAMAKNRDDRFQTTAEFVRALTPLRKQLAKTSSGQVPVRGMMNTPAVLSQSSADIPIHFSDSDASEQASPQSNEWEQTTAPMMEVPSPYEDDGQQNETVRIDSPASRRQREAKETAAKDVERDPDDPTDRMNQSEIQAIADAVREAREREKRRRG
jgi:eukaryotic-like serine/threonine-protein kinase